MIIWIVKIIRIAGIIFTKRICLSHRWLQRMGITKTLYSMLFEPDEYITHQALIHSAPGERTFYRVKVPKSPGSGKT